MIPVNHSILPSCFSAVDQSLLPTHEKRIEVLSSSNSISAELLSELTFRSLAASRIYNLHGNKIKANTHYQSAENAFEQIVTMGTKTPEYHYTQALFMAFKGVNPQDSIEVEKYLACHFMACALNKDSNKKHFNHDLEKLKQLLQEQCNPPQTEPTDSRRSSDQLQQVTPEESARLQDELQRNTEFVAFYIHYVISAIEDNECQCKNIELLVSEMVEHVMGAQSTTKKTALEILTEIVVKLIKENAVVKNDGNLATEEDIPAFMANLREKLKF